MPTNTKGFYRNEQYDIPERVEQLYERAETQRWKLDLIRPYIRGKSLLEIGPATGEFATVAVGDGFDVTLIEMDRGCCDFLREKLGCSVIESDDPVAQLNGDRRFDVICMWQTVEHIPRFWKLLEKAGQSLSAGGICVVSTPNPDSLQARLTGRRWPHVDAPRHLYLIRPDWIRAAAEKYGLQPLLITTGDAGSTGLNYYGWYLWTRNRFGERLSDKRVSRVAKFLTRTLRFLENREGAGCSYVAILARMA